MVGLFGPLGVLGTFLGMAGSSKEQSGEWLVVRPLVVPSRTPREASTHLSWPKSLAAHFSARD